MLDAIAHLRRAIELEQELDRQSVDDALASPNPTKPARIQRQFGTICLREQIGYSYTLRGAVETGDRLSMPNGRSDTLTEG